jgi:hypothetical protein
MKAISITTVNSSIDTKLMVLNVSTVRAVHNPSNVCLQNSLLLSSATNGSSSVCKDSECFLGGIILAFKKSFK